jgi:transposase
MPKIFTEDEKHQRFLFATNMKARLQQDPSFISRLLLIDESTIRIGQSCIYHNRRPISRPKVVGYQPNFYKNVNIWAGITNRTTTEPVLFCQNLRSDGYEIILENHLRPFIDANGPLHVIQDNSPIHTSGQTTDAIAANNISLIKLPTYSPDINVIELLWSHLKNYVRKKPCHTVNAVRRRVYKFFHYKITPQLLQNLFNHFKKVLDEIIQRNGDWTDM